MIIYLYHILIFCVFLFTDSHKSSENIIFTDDFNGLPRGVFNSEGGAHTEYHFIHEAMPKGNWALSTFSSGSKQNSWQVRDEEGDRVVHQVHQFKPGSFTHPILVAGDELWGNYTIEAQFRPTTGQSESGIIFRYKNDRCYYFFGISGGKAILKLVNHETGFHKPNEKILDEKPFQIPEKGWLKAIIQVDSTRLHAKFEDGPELTATDTTFIKGKIGLLADLPTKYTSVKVTMIDNDKLTFEQERSEFNRVEAELQQNRSDLYNEPDHLCRRRRHRKDKVFLSNTT
ncbi:MAG: hypothetical protein WCP85_22690 [Mariniphaga sp.]